MAEGVGRALLANTKMSMETATARNVPGATQRETEAKQM